MSVLKHKTPDCRGRFEEIKSRRRAQGKSKTVRHYTCTACRVVVSEDVEGAAWEFHQQEDFHWRMRRAAEDAQVDKKAARVIAAVVRAYLPETNESDVEDVADACVEYLRRNFVRLETDHRGISEWRGRWDAFLQPAISVIEERVRDALPEVYHPRPGVHVWPHVDWRLEEKETRACLIYHAPAEAPEDVLRLLEIELPASVSPIEGIDVVVEVKRHPAA